MVTCLSHDPQIAERQRLKKRIKKLHRRLNQLKCRLNNLLPINQLPPEILTRIFFFLQTDLSTAGQAYYCWISVLHVCRHWRNVGFEAKFLWGGINYHTGISNDSRWGTFSFNHSRPHSLEVMTKVTSVNSGFDLSDAIIRDMSRMRTLQFSLELTTSELRYLDEESVLRLTNLVQHLKDEAPLLEEFTMEGTNLFVKDGTVENPTPTVLFSGNAPRLTYIDIWNFHFHLTSIPFTSLTVLKIRYSRQSPGGISFKTFFGVLRANRLKILKICYSLREENDLDREDRTPIPLPFLEILDFRAARAQCSAFLSNVIIPPNCDILIKARVYDTEATGALNPQGFVDEAVSYLHQCLTDLIRIDLTVNKRLDGVTLDFWKQSQYAVDDTDPTKSTWAKLPLVQISYWLPTTDEDVDWFTFPKSISFPNVWMVKLCSESSSWTPPGGSDALKSVSLLISLTHAEVEGPFLETFSDHFATHPSSFELLKNLEIIRGGDYLPALEKLHDALVKRQAVSTPPEIKFAQVEGMNEGEELSKWKEILGQLKTDFQSGMPSSSTMQSSNVESTV